MRTIFLIDGFNFYHPIDAVPAFHKYKWIDFTKLVQCFIPRVDEVVQIYYFTAETKHSEEKRRRQKLYLEVLQHTGINVTFGEFKKASRKCRHCGEWYKEWNEKLTDVNIASVLISKAFEGEYEKAVIVCADYDITPAARTVKEYFPQKMIEVVIPIGREADQIKRSYDKAHRLKEEHLRSSLLPPEVRLNTGKIIKRPPEWGDVKPS